MKLTGRERGVLGTLAHNRAFTAAEVSEYTRLDRDPIHGPSLVRRLFKAGILRHADARGTYYPTSAGWDEINRQIGGAK